MSSTSTRSPSTSTTKSFKVEKSEEEWKKLLGPSRYRILRQQGTERPGSSEYDKVLPKDGYFACAACGHPLYTADSKFSSNCGWPCFDQVVYSQEGGCHVGVQNHGGNYEIICNNCGGHLGHVFYGEKCTSKNERHWVNGLAVIYEKEPLKGVTIDKVDVPDEVRAAVEKGGCPQQ